eukprot:886566-Amphidinium_carterae.1
MACIADLPADETSIEGQTKPKQTHLVKQCHVIMETCSSLREQSADHLELVPDVSMLHVTAQSWELSCASCI